MSSEMVGILYFKNHKYFKSLIISWSHSQCVHTTLPPKLHFNILCPSSNGGSIPNLPLFASNPHNSNQTIMGFPPMVSSANSIPKSPEAPSKAATLATPQLAAAQPSLPPLPLIAHNGENLDKKSGSNFHISKSLKNIVYSMCAIISRGCIFFTPFSKTIPLFLRRFFQNFLSFCMACIQERLVIKSGLWWCSYGISFQFGVIQIL